MKKDPGFVHPYMPNSVPAIKKAMLDEIGVESVEAIYKSLIPDDLLYKERLDLPEQKRYDGRVHQFSWCRMLQAPGPRPLRRDQLKGRILDGLLRRHVFGSRKNAGDL